MITKHLCYSPKEVVNIWREAAVEDVENLFGIEFAFSDGSYPSDFDWDTTDIDDGQDVDRDTFKRTEDCLLPKKYPCIVVRFEMNTHDRFGAVRVDDFDVVYIDDFSPESEIDDSEDYVFADPKAASTGS